MLLLLVSAGALLGRDTPRTPPAPALFQDSLPSAADDFTTLLVRGVVIVTKPVPGLCDVFLDEPTVGFESFFAEIEAPPPGDVTLELDRRPESFSVVPRDVDIARDDQIRLITRQDIDRDVNSVQLKTKRHQSIDGQPTNN